MEKSAAVQEARASQLLALQAELDELEVRGKHRKTIVPVSFFGAIMLFGYGSVMLEVFGAVFLIVAVVLLVGDAKVSRRKKDLRDLIGEFGERGTAPPLPPALTDAHLQKLADGRVRGTAESD